MTNKEALSYVGGATGITATLINATTSLLKTIYSFGQNLGSSIIRNIRGIQC